MLRQFIAQVRRHAVILAQCPVIRRRGRKLHIGAQIVFARLAARAPPAGTAGLECDAVANGESSDGGADRGDDTRGLVAQDHRGLDDKGTDAPGNPVVDIAAADAGVFYLDDYIVGIGDFGDGPIFVGDAVGFRKDERGVLVV